MTDPEPSQQPDDAALPLWKLVAFSIASTLVFFALLEGVLALVGVDPVLYASDPYVGFASSVPLYEEHRGPDGVVRMRTAENKLGFFNAQEFARERPEGVYRIFCVGGSTTYGRPYDDTTSFCGWLRALLPAADPSRRWEVINAGGISYASYRVAVVVEELIHYEPDLVVVYTGQNEFLERRTYEGIIETSPALLGLSAMLAHTRTWALLTSLMGRGRAAPEAARTELPSEVEAVLDASVGPADYTRDDELRARVIEHYRFNLARIVDMTRSVGGEALLVRPGSNLRDCAPFKSEHRADLTPEARARVDAAVARARSAHAAGDLEAAAEAYAEALALDDRYAGIHYEHAGVLAELGREVEARAAFERARDEDVCPLRALTPMGEIVAKVAAERRTPYVDFAALLEAESDEGIPGEDVFLDHVHPTIEANRRLALALIDELATVDIVTPGPDWGPAAAAAVSAEVEGRLDRSAHGTALRNLSKVLAWAGKFEEARRLAERSVALVPHDSEAWFQVGVTSERLGDLPAAEAAYREAVRTGPRSARAHTNLGLVLHLQDRDGEAAPYFARALELAPDDPLVQMNQASALLAQDRVDEAVAAFEAMLARSPDDAELHQRTAMAYRRAGDRPQTRRHLEEAVRLDPDRVSARYQLALAYLNAGDKARAVAELERGLGIDPDAPAVNALLGTIRGREGDQRAAVRHLRRALESRPAQPALANNLAWMLATSDDPEVRDGTEAVRWAEVMLDQAGRDDPRLLGTLAAAYAADARFDDAVRTAEEARVLAEAQGKPDVARSLDGELARYRRGEAL